MEIVFSFNPLRLTQQTPANWNLIIKKQAKIKDDQAILSTYAHIESQAISPDNSTLPLIFKACSKLNAVERGKKLHFDIKDTDFMRDVRVATSVVDFYCKCGLIEEAIKVFDQMSVKDTVLLNALVYGHVHCCRYEEAIGFSKQMLSEGFELNSRTLVALILACEGVLELRLGKEIHAYCLKHGYLDTCPHVSSALIGFYLNFDLSMSNFVFKSRGLRNVVNWNAMITGYFDAGEFSRVLELFILMINDGVKFDSVTVLIVIQACAELECLRLALQIHQLALKSNCGNDLFVVNALLNMYSKLGSLELVYKLFDSSDVRDVAIWNSMIAACIEHQRYVQANSMLTRLRTEMREDERTLVMLLSSCPKFDDGFIYGKSLHSLACKRGASMDVSVGNALLSMYAEYNCVDTALKLFGLMNDVDVITYNTLILMLTNGNLWSKALELFRMMQETKIELNSHTIASLIAGCEGDSFLNSGRSIHGFGVKYGIEMDALLTNALVDMYLSCNDEVSARSLFEACRSRDLSLWNSLIASYVRKKQHCEALLLFKHMVLEVEPDSVTIINVLSIYIELTNLCQGKCLHAYAIRRLWYHESNFALANALVSMYTRCGCMQTAEKIFKTLRKRSFSLWNAMVTGYGVHGRASDAILAFTQMLEDGFQPNEMTFLSLLSACRHAGLIEEGLQLFHSMVQDFNVTPMLAHYGCVVDLLGRSGCLVEAREFIRSMSIEPDASIWRTLLTACHVHSNTELAMDVFENLIELEPLNTGNYILLSKIYADAGLWPEVREIRRWLKERGLRKPPGTSWLTVNGQNHSFTAGDTSHPQSDEIYSTLISLMGLLREPESAMDYNSIVEVECY